MGFRKCPICELNYISDEEKCCGVCKRAQHGGNDNDDAVIMCIECGEHPAVRGSELCAACLREARRQEKLQKVEETMQDADLDVSALDDMEVPIGEGDDDIPETEMQEIHRELDGDYEDEDEEDDETGDDEEDDMQ